jgi:hypothetical protein
MPGGILLTGVHSIAEHRCQPAEPLALAFLELGMASEEVIDPDLASPQPEVDEQVEQRFDSLGHGSGSWEAICIDRDGRGLSRASSHPVFSFTAVP